METKMLEEFENICVKLNNTENLSTTQIIEKRLMHVRSFMLKCGVDVKKIEAIELKHNL